jgi:diacylglycerol kinase (ATP)
VNTASSDAEVTSSNSGPRTSDAVAIFNPAAGRDLAMRLEPRIRAELERHFPGLRTQRTSGPGDATRLTREAAAEAEVVIAVGGDGTVREVASGLVGTKAELAVVPVGSGNDLLKTLELGTGLVESCRRARFGRPRLIDINRVTISDDSGTRELCSANAAGFGFDAAVVTEAMKFRWLRGLPLYAIAVYQAVIHLHCPMARITAGGKTWEQRITLLAATNGKFYGGGMRIAPGAELDDGMMEICLIEAVSRFFVMRKLPNLVAGTHVTMKQARMMRLRELEIEFLEPAPFQLDGDVLKASGLPRFRLEVLPRAVTIRV